MFDKDLKKYPWLTEFCLIFDGFEINLTSPCKPEKPLDAQFHFPSLHHKHFHRWEMGRVDKLIKQLERQFE